MMYRAEALMSSRAFCGIERASVRGRDFRVYQAGTVMGMEQKTAEGEHNIARRMRIQRLQTINDFYVFFLLFL